MLKVAGQLATRVALGFVALVLSHAALEACHYWGLYPERWVAQLIITTPTLLEDKLARLGLTLLLAIVLWGILDYFFYRHRSGKKRTKLTKLANGEPVRKRRAEVSSDDDLWPIRDLFFYLRPDLLSNDQQDLWDKVGMLVLDKLSAGQFVAWGRVAGDGNKPITEISKMYWGEAKFTYWFLEKGHEQTVHVENKKAGLAYRDLQLSRSRSQELWPRSLVDVSVEIFNAETMIGNCRAICTVQLTNIGRPERDLDGCLVKIDQFTWPTPEGMPMPLALRTEGQINRKDRGPFRLRTTERKTIPILFQARPRKNEWFVFDENGKRHFLPSGSRSMLIGVYGAKAEGKALIKVRVGPEFRSEAELTMVPDDYSLVDHQRGRSFTANPNDPELMQLRRDISWLAEMLSRYEPLGIDRPEVVERYQRVERSDHPIWLLNPARQLRRDFLNRSGRAIASDRRDYVDQRERDETVSEMWDAAERLEAILSRV